MNIDEVLAALSPEARAQLCSHWWIESARERTRWLDPHIVRELVVWRIVLQQDTPIRATKDGRKREVSCLLTEFGSEVVEAARVLAKAEDSLRVR